MGLALIIGGVAIWGFAISVLIAWLSFCFGTVVVGILLLIFAPTLLLAPLAIGVPGTAIFVGGLALIVEK